MNVRKQFFKVQIASLIFYIYLFIGAILVLSTSYPFKNWVVGIGGILAFILAVWHLAIYSQFKMDGDFYKDYDELQEKKKEVDKDYDHVKEIIEVIGKHEAVKFWEENKVKGEHPKENIIEELWDDIFDDYQKENYPPFGGPFTDAISIEEYLKRNYNPPKRKS